MNGLIPYADMPMEAQPIPRALRDARPADGGISQDIGNYEVTIRQTENGFSANVGCKVFSFNKLEDVLSGVQMYFDNPKLAAKRYLRDAGKSFGIE